MRPPAVRSTRLHSKGETNVDNLSPLARRARQEDTLPKTHKDQP